MKRSLKNLSINFCVICLLLCSAFKTQIDAIYPEQVDWDTHYLAEPDEHSAYFALTATTWHYSYHATIHQNNLHIDFQFSAGVDPNRSWVKLKKIRGSEAKQKLLNHEQGHVNINFLLLKDGEQKIRFQKYTSRNYKKSIQDNANKVSAYYSEMQNRYDDETKHGSDDVAQQRWNRLIESDLKKFLK